MSIVKSEREYLKKSLIEDFFYTTLLIQKNLKRDHNCAIKIQTYFRKYIKQKKYNIFLEKAYKVLFFLRGCYVRLKIKESKLKAQESKNIKYFDAMALIIQRTYRGYYSRKYIHSFFGRRKILKNIEKKNKEVIDNMLKNKKELTEYYATVEKQLTEKKCEDTASKVHHLISTTHIPGIYNPPYGTVKKIKNEEAETFIKKTFKKKFIINFKTIKN